MAVSYGDLRTGMFRSKIFIQTCIDFFLLIVVKMLQTNEEGPWEYLLDTELWVSKKCFAVVFIVKKRKVGRNADKIEDG